MPKIRRNFGHWEKKTGILPKGTHFGGLKGGWGGEAGAEGWISTDRGKLMVKFSFHIIVMFHKTRFLDLCRMMKK